MYYSRFSFSFFSAELFFIERLLTTRKRLLVMVLHVLYWSPANKELGGQSCWKRKAFILWANLNHFHYTCYSCLMILSCKLCVCLLGSESLCCFAQLCHSSSVRAVLIQSEIACCIQSFCLAAKSLAPTTSWAVPAKQKSQRWWGLSAFASDFSQQDIRDWSRCLWVFTARILLDVFHAYLVLHPARQKKFSLQMVQHFPSYSVPF